MKKSSLFNVYKNIVHLTQFGVSVSCPIILTLWGASWLVNEKGVGAWVYLVAIILGLGASACSFYGFLKFIKNKNNH